MVKFHNKTPTQPAVLLLSKKEATRLIAHLALDLGDTHLPGVSPFHYYVNCENLGHLTIAVTDED